MTGFGRLLEELNGAGVQYVVIGGIAVIRHGVVRATKDLDVGVPAPICSPADLVVMKRQGGRSTDDEDLRRLETAHGELPAAPQAADER